MKPAIVKWTVDLLAPGAVISPTLTNWYAKHVAFHSRRALFPNLPIRELLDIQDDGSKALQDFMHVRATSIMEEYDGATDGELDRLLTLKPLEEVFDLGRVMQVALQNSQPYQIGFTRAGWLELFEVEDETVTYIRPFSLLETNKAPTT